MTFLLWVDKPSLALAIKIEKYSKGEVTVSGLLGFHDALENPDFLGENQSFIEKMIDKKLEPLHQQLECLDKRLKKIENI